MAIEPRPVISALILVVIISVPGYLRLEWLANRAGQTAAEVATLVAQQKALDAKLVEQRERLVLTECQLRNSAARRERLTTRLILDRLISVGANQRLVDQARTKIPEIEDEASDCTRDGAITGQDFLPTAEGAR